MSIPASTLLSALPATLRDELFEEFNKILRNYRESKWEPAELDGGKLCEIIYSILNGHIQGAYPASAFKPANFYDACKLFEKAGTAFSRSIKVQIPRVLIALYEIRNNRGVGHVGGDVDPNHMDATFVVAAAKWLLAEVIRLFHSVSTEDASKAVEEIIVKETPVVWHTGTAKRVLKPGLSFKEQILLLLYSCTNGEASDEELFDWVEYSKKNLFKTNVLRPLHKARLLEYQASSGSVKISPLGIQEVESHLLN